MHSLPDTNKRAMSTMHGRPLRLHLLRPRGGSRYQVECGCVLSYAEDFASWLLWAVFAATIVAVSVAATEGLIRMFSPLFSRYTMAPEGALGLQGTNPAGWRNSRYCRHTLLCR